MTKLTFGILLGMARSLKRDGAPIWAWRPYLAGLIKGAKNYFVEVNNGRD